jgi:hypothetical protein
VDEGRIALILWGLIIGLLVGFGIATLWTGYKRKPPFLSATEYWVYLPGTELPAQQDIMHRMLAANPHGRPGDPPLGPREGVIFSDIRLHIVLVLKAKNPHAFGPNAFTEDVEASPEQLKALAENNSFVRIRYISEQPLPDRRHLTFLTHAAEAIADLGGGTDIYDLTSERLMQKSDLIKALDEDPSGTSPKMHLRVLWKSATVGWHAETRGLRKIGFDDLVSSEMEPDQRVLVGEVMQEALRKIWNEGSASDDLEVEAFDDLFRIHKLKGKKGTQQVQILRVQAL